jgi:hypothetical protein
LRLCCSANGTGSQQMHDFVSAWIAPAVGVPLARGMMSPQARARDPAQRSRLPHSPPRPAMHVTARNWRGRGRPTAFHGGIQCFTVDVVGSTTTSEHKTERLSRFSPFPIAGQEARHSLLSAQLHPSIHSLWTLHPSIATLQIDRTRRQHPSIPPRRPIQLLPISRCLSLLP